MVCTASDLQEWKDFPKGLKVLLLDQDSDSASEIRSKLELMDYTVSTFCNEDEALLAIASKPDSFHIALVEVNTSCDGSFQFLEAARDLPTIMMSNNHCLSTMMKCIALGAVEFLPKPLCEDKLRNIWQHVAHKAFNAGVGGVSDSLKPVKETLVSMLQLPVKNEDENNDESVETRKASLHETDREMSTASDKYPAPSTPQLKRGTLLLDDGDCQDQTNSTVEKESGEQDGESKFVETTCDDSMSENPREAQGQRVREGPVKEEDNSADNSKCESMVSPLSENKDGPRDSHGSDDNLSKASSLRNSVGTRVNRKKMKVDWTPELHKKFVQAVEQLGVDQAIPSRILDLMKVEGLTRHNVASHLQKYRMHRRHILPKEDERRWPHSRDGVARSYYPHRPIMAYPPHHSGHPLPPGAAYPVWAPPSNHPAGLQMWGPPGYPPWHTPENWHWKPAYPGFQMHADVWGCPVMPPSHHSPGFAFPPNAPGCHGPDRLENSFAGNLFDYHPDEEVIDNIVKEAISKPWLPLPLGLKPPSTDSVLAELSRQGIPSIPPHANRPGPC
ncbi:two-component response regulator-like APRR2 isoform X1 [Rhodamnia argentea]|uniref:Two-component response regulator-like APRR2 isoform X1 n=1 Tax=Rhodamnia argentea TaxID=178133 RepID=A0A8B8PGX9_9MYRT|nr:two-component response regulator-like APRR2 isoform X1 [Rhodamnia argentea]XP_030533720.1 two-component response regulator-like APRR2 isoform X1 [Rhodamnia argentea]XP_048132890.1 two-component response regulator-like APRR2 isoform X1 [Rhodamnia argentea]XP_048132891.1 two-component response regulator-like APRR2 isoform X1 [Rhodamnia argentea]